MECLSKTENSVIVYMYDIPFVEHKRRHFEKKMFEFFFPSCNESQWDPILFKNPLTLTEWMKTNIFCVTQNHTGLEWDEGE